MRDVPETVACPCENGYAERTDRAIRERVRQSGTAERKTRLTVTYRHEGCPVGGHLVVQEGHVKRRAGPLFEDNPNVERLRAFAAGRTVAADGGEPQ